jgi:hypothetical protein
VHVLHGGVEGDVAGERLDDDGRDGTITGAV